MKKITTGSKEFWQDGKDDDFLTIDTEQKDVFKHIRDNEKKICVFSWNVKNKEELLDFMEKNNSWYLNTACLTCKEFMEYLKVDYFGEDKDRLIAIHRKLFDFVYRNIPVNAWNKYAYRLLAFVYYMKNSKLELTQEQLNNMLLVKQRKGTQEIANDVYEFYG